MPGLPRKKVGLISCSGEELPEGTLSRLATLRVLEQMRPGDTVTLCLPLFLAGGDKERAFARFYPTIAIDGCDKRCAARATEQYSARPAASIVITEFLGVRGLPAPRSRRMSEASSEPAVDALAHEIATQVDTLLGVRPAVAAGESTPEAAVMATCSCGSGLPITRLNIAGRAVEVVALPLIFEQSRDEGRSADELFEAVKVYNAIPSGIERAYRAALLEAYSRFCDRPGAS